MNAPYDKYRKVPATKESRLLEARPSSMTHDAMREELFEIETEMNRLRTYLAEPVPGKLLVSGTNASPKYYLEEDAGTRYLPRAEIGLAAAVAQKEYDECLLSVLEERHARLAKAITCLEQLDPQLVFQNLSEKRKRLVVPEYLPDEEFLQRWSARSYSGKGFLPGEKEYYTARGERVRSKSETDIADRCYYRDVFYLYEYPWTLSGAGVWFPDFTVVNVRTRKVYLWEHLGMESDGDYAVKSLRKLRIYQKNGFWLGENLILTHETEDQPLTVRDIDAVIDHYLV